MYADAEQVVSVHGYIYPVQSELPETFFLKGAECWGWGTWARGWRVFEPNGAKLLAELRRRKLTWQFDLDGASPATRKLEDQIAGKIDSWAMRWHAAAFLADMLTLYPGRSLVQNIGHDSSGTHCRVIESFTAALTEKPIDVKAIPLKEDAQARLSVARFYRDQRGTLVVRILNRIRRMLSKERQ